MCSAYKKLEFGREKVVHRKKYIWAKERSGMKRCGLMIYISAIMSMPAKPATATCAEASEAAPLPSSLTPGTADDDEDEPVAVLERPVALAV